MTNPKGAPVLAGENTPTGVVKSKAGIVALMKSSVNVPLTVPALPAKVPVKSYAIVSAFALGLLRRTPAHTSRMNEQRDARGVFLPDFRPIRSVLMSSLPENRIGLLG